MLNQQDRFSDLILKMERSNPEKLKGYFYGNIEGLIEEISLHSDGQQTQDQNKEQNQKFLDDLSQNLNKFINNLIYQVNQEKKKEKKKRKYSPKILQNEMEIQKSNTSEIDQLISSESYPHNDKINIESIESNFSKNHSQKDSVRQIKKQYKIKQHYLKNKPKKPISSFFLFYKQKMKDFEVNNKNLTSAKLSKQISKLWNQSSQQQKDPYIKRSRQIKNIYQEQMTSFLEKNSELIDEITKLKRMKNNKLRNLKKKQGGKDNEVPAQDSSDIEEKNIKIKGISTRQLKNQSRKAYKNRPKAPISNFFLFYQCVAKEIAKKQNISSGSQISKIASKMWKELPLQEKEIYNKKAGEKREVYYQQMIQYKIDYPQEFESRKKRISKIMKKRIQQMQTTKSSKNQKDGENQKDSDSNSSSSSSNQDSNSSSSSSSESGESDSNSKSQQNDSDQQSSQVEVQKESLKKNFKNAKLNKLKHLPKGPKCSFFHYYNQHLKEFMEEYKSVPGSQLTKKASEKWKTLNESQKQVYHKQSQKNRKNYIKDMDKFKKKYPDEYKKYIEIKNTKNKRKLK